jgi:hypothetical protein
MKKLVASLALAAAIALLPAQAGSADTLDLTAGVFPDNELTAASSSGDPFAVGGGTNAGGTHFAFSAHCPFGFCRTDSGAAWGYAVVSDASGSIQGKVVCYEARPFGGRPGTLFGFRVERASGVYATNPVVLGELAAYLAFDNGKPSSSPPDEFDIAGIADCPLTPGGNAPLGSGPVVQGNIVVK